MASSKTRISAKHKQLLLVAAIDKFNSSKKWKFTIKEKSSDGKDPIIHGHHLIKASRILILEKVISKELSQVLISSYISYIF